MISRSLHQFSRNEIDFKRELEVLRESTKQALELAWKENSEKESRVAALERQVQEMIKREASYKHQIVDLTKQVRRNMSNSRPNQALLKAGQCSPGSARVLESFVASPRRVPPSPNSSQKRRPSITPSFPPPNLHRRSSGSGSVSDILDFFGSKKSGDVEQIEQERATQVARLEEQRRLEMEEAQAKLESQEKLIENLERANRKHVRTILTLQEELRNEKKESDETEHSLQARLQEKRETIAKQVKELQHYQAYVGDLTYELEKACGKDSSHVKTRTVSAKNAALHESSRILVIAHQA